MTEAEWLAPDPHGSGRILSEIHRYATIRQMRLIAAVHVRGCELVTSDAKECSHVIERVADHPQPPAELEAELSMLPGTWRFTHILNRDSEETVARELRRLFALYLNPLHPEPGHPAELVREVVGNPFRPVVFDPAWRTEAVRGIAQQAYDSREFGTLPVLADALQDAGCEDADLLAHLRGPGPHVRGCWAVDLALGIDRA